MLRRATAPREQSLENDENARIYSPTAQTATKRRERNSSPSKRRRTKESSLTYFCIIVARFTVILAGFIMGAYFYFLFKFMHSAKIGVMSTRAHEIKKDELLKRLKARVSERKKLRSKVTRFKKNQAAPASKTKEGKNIETPSSLWSLLPFASEESTAERGSGASQTAPLTYERPGVIVLGMHRSGTSMLTGLLTEGVGFHAGGPLMEGNEHNAKGHFERLDVFHQNIEFLTKQGLDWNKNVVSYDTDRSLRQMIKHKVHFKFGMHGLTFFDSKEKLPWVQKDPRMCITLPTWLELMQAEPAILFTYRSPLEVANSINRRDNISFSRALWLWIAYNTKAIQNSASLCRVVTSNYQLLDDPMAEIQSIVNRLTSVCGLPPPSKELLPEVLEEFVDENLQQEKKNDIQILTKFGNCVVPKYRNTRLKNGSRLAGREMDLYLMAMKMYCDMINGEAFRDGYQFPNLQQRNVRLDMGLSL